MTRLVALLLAGCVDAPVETLGLPVSVECEHNEVACGVRTSRGELEFRCILLCQSGVWAALECEPNCGPARTATGRNHTMCQLPAIACP